MLGRALQIPALDPAQIKGVVLREDWDVQIVDAGAVPAAYRSPTSS